jgi:hypothetical protein
VQLLAAFVLCALDVWSGREIVCALDVWSGREIVADTTNTATDIPVNSNIVLKFILKKQILQQDVK